MPQQTKDAGGWEIVKPADNSGWEQVSSAPATPPATKAAPANPGFFKTLGSDLAAVLRPAGFNPYPGMGQTEKAAAAGQSYEEDQARKKAGYSVPYRATVPFAESVGVNVTGMEESAKAGDVGGVLGHAAAVPVMLGTGAGLSKVGELRASAAERMQPFARKVTGVEPAVKDAVTKAADTHAEAVTENTAKRADVSEQNAAQQQSVAKHGELAKTVDEQSQKLHEHITNVEKSVGAEADRKFNAVREKIGVTPEDPGPTVPADRLVATVNDIQQNVLQGIPENIKEFKSILESEAPPPNLAGAVKEHYGWEMEGGEPLTWDKLQSIKSRIDSRLRNSRGMNGDLKRGLYKLQDAVVTEMGGIADSKGATGEWAQARDFYRNYKQDFHEPSGPSGSGSPVAQALDAVDPKNIRQPFLNKQSTIGNRGVQILRKYPEHGGDEAATHAEGLLENHKQMSDLPAKAKDKPLPKPPENPTVDINKTAKDAIATRAKNWGNFNARDVGILTSSFIGAPILWLLNDRNLAGAAVGAGLFEGGKYVASRALNSPKIVEWLAQTPPEEAAVLAKIPGADKVRIVNGLTESALEQARTSGKPVALSQSAKQLLGPQNVARILAASSGGVKNRKDALNLLGRSPQ